MSDKRSIFDVVHKYFGDSQWVTTQFTGKPILRFSHVGKNGSWVCIAHARESEERFVFYSIGITGMLEAKRLAMAEFITRANFGLIIGNFEMDLNDGEVRFKTSIDVDGDRLSAALLKQLVDVNLEMMDKYLPGMLAVIDTDTSPADAVMGVEGPTTARFEG